MFSPQSNSAPAFTGTGGGERKQDRADMREKWIIGVIYDYFRGTVKVDKLNKYLSSDDCLSTVRDFMDVPDERFVCLKESGTAVQIARKPPNNVKGRILYLLKNFYRNGYFSFNRFFTLSLLQVKFINPSSTSFRA